MNLYHPRQYDSIKNDIVQCQPVEGIRQFVLEEYYAAHEEGEIRLWTGHTDNVTDSRKCYVYHPEDLCLYIMTKVKTGKSKKQMCDKYFGRDYARWQLGYCWIILHVDKRYKDVSGL